MAPLSTTFFATACRDSIYNAGEWVLEWLTITRARKRTRSLSSLKAHEPSAQQWRR